MTVSVYIEKTSVCEWHLTKKHHYFNIWAIKESSIPMSFNCSWKPNFS